MDREKVVRELTNQKRFVRAGSEEDKTLDSALALLKEQEAKTGHWTTHRTNQHDGEWYCDQCDYEPTVYESMPYCPNCGARMEQDK